MALRDILVSFGFEVDHGELEKGEKHAGSLLEKLEHLGKFAATAFIGHEVKEFFESTVEGARELAKASVMLGMPAQELQTLEHAANMADVSAETLRFGVMRLQRSLYSAGEGGGELAGVFKKLGIETQNADKTTRPTVDVLADFAEAIKNTEDPAKRTGLAMQVFGKSGAQLLPFLAKGKGGFAEVRDEVEKLGGGFSEEFLESTEEYEDAVKRLTFEMRSLRVAIVTGLVPAATWLTDKFRWLIDGIVHLGKQVDLGRLAMTAMLMFALSKFPALISMVWTFVRTSALAAAPWILAFLVIEDLIGLFTGADSLAGDIIDHFFGTGAAEKFVADCKAMFDSWSNFGAGIKAFLGAAGSNLIQWFVDQAKYWDNVLAYMLKFIDGFARIKAMISGESQSDYNKRIAGEYDQRQADIGAESQAVTDANRSSYQRDFAKIRDAAVERKIIADREAQLNQSKPVDWVSPAREVTAPGGSTSHQVVHAEHNDHSVINVTTLPATTASQGKEIGRAVAKAKAQSGENRANLNALEFATE